MHTLDASSILYAWDNYPPDIFPPLWAWLGKEIVRHELTIPVVALEEVQHKASECADWLKAHNVRRLSMTNHVIQCAARLQTLIGVINDGYHPKGVDENDLLIIAAAKIYDGKLITNESRQLDKQPIPAKRKIPAVCDMDGVKVKTLNFLEYIRQSGQVFSS